MPIEAQVGRTAESVRYWLGVIESADDLLTSLGLPKEQAATDDEQSVAGRNFSE
jgi:hypothetical protein